MSHMEVEVVEVIRTIHNRGEGHHGDPVRRVLRFWSRDGELLAEHDPCENERWRRFARTALLDASDPDTPGDDAAKEFYRGWNAARDVLDETMASAQPGRED